MAGLAPFVQQIFFDNNGKPLVGGKIYTYLAGTTTPKATFTDSTGLTSNTNPIILDANGQANIWLSPAAIKMIITDSNDVVLKTIDNVVAGGGGSGGGVADADYTFGGYSSRFSQIFNSTGLEDTLSKILLITYSAPTISLSASGSSTVREKGAVVGSTTLTATVTKRSDPIADVKFFLSPSTLLSTKTGTIASGGTETHNYATPFSDTTSFYATTTDAGATGGPSTVTSNTVTFTHVYPYYYGAGGTSLTPSQVASLTKDVIVSTATKNVTFTATAGQVFYLAYPASYPALTSILDVNNFETIGDWTVSTISIIGLDGTSQSYRQYKFNNPVTAGSYQYTFKR